MAVVQATRKPPHYFLKHTVIVVTQLPLKSALQSVDYSGRVAKRSLALRVSDVRCVPRALDKGLILAGLVVQSAGSPTERKLMVKLSARQNQGIAWSSDSSL